MIKFEKLGKFHLAVNPGDGQIFLPYSHWLNQLSSDQVSSRLKREDAVRKLVRFFEISGIDMVRNILSFNQLMSLQDGRALRNFCFLKADKLKASDQYLRKAYLNLPIADVEKRRNLIVMRNTARSTAIYIAQFLEFYVKEFGAAVVGDQERLQHLNVNTSILISEICSIRPSKTNHPNEIRSYPVDRFQEIVKTICNLPEKVFVTEKGRVSQTPKRDQLVVMLAAEGLRRGEIGNLMLTDFTERSGSLYVCIRDHLEARKEITSNTARAKNKASGRGIGEHQLKLSRATHRIYQDYLSGERLRSFRRFGVGAVRAETGESWLFANSRGSEVLKTASLVDETFKRTEIGLKKLGLLELAEHDPYGSDDSLYECTPHWFRHSSACLFVATFYESNDRQRSNEKLFALMRMRFGWTRTSEMPQRYADRALQDETNKLVDQMNAPFFSELNLD